MSLGPSYLLMSFAAAAQPFEDSTSRYRSLPFPSLEMMEREVNLALPSYVLFGILDALKLG